MVRTVGKNRWALFLLVLAGIVAGSFLGYLVRNIKYLSWLNYGIDFAIGDTGGKNVLILDLGALVIQFGLRLKITVGSIIGAAISVIIYKKI